MAKADEQQLQDALAKIEKLERELEKIRGGQAASPSDLPDSPVKKTGSSNSRKNPITTLRRLEESRKWDKADLKDFAIIKKALVEWGETKSTSDLPAPPPIKAKFESLEDLGEEAIKESVKSVPGGVKIVTKPDDGVESSFDVDAKGSMIQLPNSPPGTPESWKFDIRFPSAENLRGFPNQIFAGILWQWKHSRPDIINPVLLGNHLSLDYRNEPGADGLHFRLVQPIREGGRVNDFEYVNYPIPDRPALQFDHTYHIEIDVLHSSDTDGFFRAYVDDFLVVDYAGPTMPAYPENLDPILQFGHTSFREKTNAVEFTNIVRTK